MRSAPGFEGSASRASAAVRKRWAGTPMPSGFCQPTTVVPLAAASVTVAARPSGSEPVVPRFSSSFIRCRWTLSVRPPAASRARPFPSATW